MRTLLALLALFLALSTSQSWAVPESELTPNLSGMLENRDSFFQTGTFRGVDQAHISYVRYGSQPGTRGCMVISPGQGEAALKYIELAHDLVALGYAPVYAIDHRGQGFSSRLLPDRQKSHVNRFSDYVSDFTTFVNSVVQGDAACRGHDLNLLAHSMGGAIATLYLEREADNTPFRRAVLSAPMHKIAFPAGKTERSVLFETWVACNTPFGPSCEDFAPGKGAYDPNARFEANPYTHSEARFGIKKEIFSRWPELQVGGPTVQWVRESARADRILRKSSNASRIARPVLILQAGNDQIVDNSGQSELCSSVKSCRIERLEGGNHELLLESDPVRDSALRSLVQFLDAK